MKTYVSFGSKVATPLWIAGLILTNGLVSSALASNVTGWGNQVVYPLNGLGGGFAKIAAGGDHNLALKADGTVVAWGHNNLRQSTVPSGLSGVVGVAAGWWHSLGLKGDGTVVTWGYDYGYMGNVPSDLSGAIAVAAGAYHSAALKGDGTVVAWGEDRYGQCTVLRGLSGVVAITAGWEHSLALLQNGTVVAGGFNGWGQCTVPIGLSDVMAIATARYHSLALKRNGTVVVWGGYPNFVPSGLSGVVAIAAGEGYDLALKADGTVVAWGANDLGQCNVPSGLNGVTAIAAGNAHCLALMGDGTIVTWGANWSGQSTLPTGLGGVTAVAAGYQHNLALKADHSVFTWGANDFGQCTVPSSLGAVTAVAAGGYHSLALKEDATVATWGYNNLGQSTVPSGLGGVKAIAAGLYFSLALKDNGTVLAWGANDYGQTTVPSSLSGVTAIAAGFYYCLALKDDGTVVAWGDNGRGQCSVPPGLNGVKAIAAGYRDSLALKSDGTVVAWGIDAARVPDGLMGVKAIAVGDGFSHALRQDGTIVTWGWSDYFPVAAPSGLSGVTAITACGLHSLALFGEASPTPATITLSDLNHTYDGTPKAATVTTVPPSLAVVVTYSGSATVPINAGSYAVMATVTDPNYTGSASGTLVIAPAIPPGTKLWEFVTAAEVNSSPALGRDGTLYFGSADNHVYAVDTATGTLRWAFDAQCYVQSSPSIGADGTVYIGADDGRVYAFKGADGTKLWEFRAGMVQSSPAIGADGTVYVASFDRNLYALVGATGAERWRYATGGGMCGSPAIAPDGVVYVAAHDGWVYAVDGALGTLRWKFDRGQTGSWEDASPALGGDGTVYVGSKNGKVYALDGVNGQKKWEFNTGNAVVSTPALGNDGLLYVGSDNGNVYALDWTTGAQRWATQVGHWGMSSVALGIDGTLYIGSRGSGPRALNARTGQVQWQFSEGGSDSSPVIGPDGTVYIGGGGRPAKVYAISSSSVGGLADSAWPMFHQNARHTGRAGSDSTLINPVITAQPASQTVAAGMAATFIVTATGTDPLTYQWRKGGGNLTDGGDVSGATTATLTIANTEVADVDTYDVVVANAAGSVTSDPATLTVNPTAATVTLSDLNQIYDGSPKPATVTTVPAGLAVMVTYDDSATVPINAGGYAVVATVNDPNYTGSATATLVIAKADATVTVTPYGVTYDGAAHTATGTATGAGGENLSALLAMSGTTHTGAGDYPADAWSFPGDANHNSASGTVHNTIAKANAVVTVSGYTGVYDGNAHDASGAATGVQGENLSAGLNLGAAFTDVPGGIAQWTFSGGPNYNDQSGHAAIVFNKANATITVNGYTGVYDGNAHGASGTATGVQGEDLSAGLNLGPAFAEVPGGTAHWTFSGGQNYNDQNGDAAIVLSKANATVAANPKSKTYGDANPELTAVVSGTVGSDTLAYTLATTATASSGVGSYPITVTLGVNPNYNVTSADGTLTVNAKAATVVADDQSRVFGQPNPTFTGSISGLRNGDSFPVSFNCAATAASLVGTYPIVPSIQDEGGKLGNYTVSLVNGTLTITPAALDVTIHSPASGFLQTINTPIAFTGSFTLTGTEGAYSAHWTVSSATIPETIIPATVDGENVSAQIQFPTPGVYLIRLTVEDAAGAVGEADLVEKDLLAYVVIYDPSGGFVTGGGWINSPAGAFHPDLVELAGVTGKATFGFVAKYLKGAKVPSGNTEFQFKAGNLNFKSAAYQWLTVAGARAQYKGWGTINGEGGYAFMLTAIDGALLGGKAVDRFRIKIWDVGSGVVIYDNQAGAGDTADLTADGTLLGGGSIVIHKP